MTNMPTPEQLTPRIKEHLLKQAQRLFDSSVTSAGAVHQMRVASRRLRVGLCIFAELFEPRDLKQVQQHLRRVTRSLGPVRTLDVSLKLLRTAKASPVLQRTLARERQERLVEARGLLRLLAAAKFPDCVEDLIVGKARHRDERQLLRDADVKLAERRRVLRKRLRRFSARRNGAAFHKLRIAAKKYRYALEAVQAVFAVDAAEPIAAVVRLQDLMGDCHDAEAALDWLRVHKKEFAVEARGLIRYFQVEQRRRFARVEKHLGGGCRWLRKVKLKLNHE